MDSDELDLAYRLLDLDLVDRDGRRCGKVDDIEIHGEPGGPAYVGALIAGTSALKARMPIWLRRSLGRWFSGEAQAIKWQEVEDFDSAVELRLRADELGLGRGDDSAGRLIQRIPGGRK